MRYNAPLLALVLSAVTATTIAAQPSMRVMPSGRGTSEVTLMLVDSAARAAATPSVIRVDYGQPHLRGRQLHTDSLVPYDKPWRTGANASTTLTTDVDLVIGGKNLPKGKYVLQTLPSRTGWKLLVQKEVTLPAGAPEPPYDPAKDIAQIDLRHAALRTPVESLTMWLIPSRDDTAPRGALVIAWGSSSLSTDWSVKKR